MEGQEVFFVVSVKRESRDDDGRCDGELYGRARLFTPLERVWRGRGMNPLNAGP